jgi:hypothetical protein
VVGVTERVGHGGQTSSYPVLPLRTCDSGHGCHKPWQPTAAQQMGTVAKWVPFLPNLTNPSESEITDGYSGEVTDVSSPRKWKS